MLVEIIKFIVYSGPIVLISKYILVTTLRKLAEALNLKAKTVFKTEEETVWICRNCGHIHYGTEAPEVCPICAHPQSYFERKSTNY